jgi:hypothetical protein
MAGMTFRCTSVLRSFAAQLTLALFALRALVPAGYMPDLGAARAGQVRIVICTGYGSKSVLVDESGKPIDDQGGRKHAAAGDCPFGAAPAAALTVPDPAAALPLPNLRQAFLAPDSVPALLPPAQGSPLGPRAPPVRLG